MNLKSNKCVYDYKNKNIKLRIIAENNKIIGIFFIKRIYYSNKNKIIKKCVKQLDEYFEGKRKEFSISVKYRGSNFEKRVWNKLREIKYGQLVSYKYIAEQINNPQAYRAVANACKKNPIPIIIPCHRVIKNNGEYGGFAGGKNIKTYLINNEKSNDSMLRIQ